MEASLAHKRLDTVLLLREVEGVERLVVEGSIRPIVDRDGGELGGELVIKFCVIIRHEQARDQNDEFDGQIK